MNIEELRDYCLSKKATEESMPFGDDTLVIKVGGKMFLLANLNGPLSINIKALPEEVIDRIERYPEVNPGYHMNKKHWVTIVLDLAHDEWLIKQWIDDSYTLVVESLPRKLKSFYGL